MRSLSLSSYESIGFSVLRILPNAQTASILANELLMLTPASILVCGHDARLLEIRRWVLEKESACVYTTQTLAEIGEIIAAEKIDLMVLCHTLTVDELTEVLDEVETLRPDMKNLILTSYHLGPRAAGRGMVLNAAEGPQALINAVRSMLAVSTSA
jgi:DNA-binding NtrC family response regulator